MARYEQGEGAAAVFWEYEVKGTSYTARWGKIGDRLVHSQVFEFDTRGEAWGAIGHAVARLRAKGYLMIGPDGQRRPPDPEPESPRQPEPAPKKPKPRRKKPKRSPFDARAEAALVESPEDPRVWQVYADAMLQTGEAWGEVIVAACTRKKPSAKLAEGTAEILGACAGTDGCSLTWKHGAVDELVLAPEDEDGESPLPALERALAHPAGRLMRTLILGLCPRSLGEWNFEAHLELLASGPVLPLLHTLDLSREPSFMDQPSFRRIGDLRPLWAVAPRLRELRLFGGPGTDRGLPIALGAIAAPHLETLVFKSGGLDRSVSRDLGKASLPRLARLELWFGQAEYGNNHTLKDLAGILGGAKLPALRSLGLRNSEWRAELIEAIATSAILPQLAELDLDDGTLGDESASVLLQHAASFAHLKRLSLANNYFAASSARSLKRVIPGLAFGAQREGDEEDRYTEIGE